jgi:hypothetical protein
MNIADLVKKSSHCNGLGRCDNERTRTIARHWKIAIRNVVNTVRERTERLPGALYRCSTGNHSQDVTGSAD